MSLQKAVRDKHIEQLVETANSLRHTSDCLQEENLTLRERLHISPEEQVLTSTVVLKNKEQNVYKVQQQRIDRLEEDLISAKMDRRFLSQQILALKNKLCDLQKHPQDVQKTGNKQQNRHQADARAAARKIRALQQEQRQLDNEHQVLIEENEALRQGLHDILDSVHNQDGKSNVRLESKVLEQLLHALDSRHISGWYHPAMRIQAKVNAVEGSNEALREQLHSMREEELKIQDELHKAKLHIAELEGNMTEAQAPSHPTDEACSQKLKTEKESLPFVLPVELSAQGCDLISKMNNHLLQVLHENEVEKSHMNETVRIQKEFQLHLDDVVSQLTQTIQQQNTEKQRWEEEKSKLEDDIVSMKANLAASEARISQLSSLWDTFAAQDEIKSGIVKDIYNAVDLLAEKEKYCRIAKSALQYAQNTKNQCKVTKSEWNTSKDRLMKQMEDLLKFKKTSLLRMTDLQMMSINSVPVPSLIAANKQREEIAFKYNQLLRQLEISEHKSSMKIKQLMTELEQERDVKHDLARRLEDVNKKLWSKNIDSNDSSQELSTLLARTEAEALRDKHHAQHAEKMAGIIKEEIKLLSGRCSMLEEEVVALLKTNQENKIETSFFCHLCLIRNKTGDEDSVESQLSRAQAEVMELQVSRETLQELADISQAQVQMLDQLHERSELQLDSLRQVLYKLQGETDLSSELVRLSEELCASQVSEMSAWNQITSLEKWNREVLEANEAQAKEIEELNNKLNVEKQQFLEQFGKMQEEIINLRGHSENTLPLPFFHLLVTAYTQCSAENRDLWHCLQDVKEELFSLKSDSEKDSVSCQQTLELQRAIQASHSDVECQRLMELWAAELTELKINALKSTRLLDTLESNLKQAHERLQNRETLLSSLEQQMLSFGTKRQSRDRHKETVVIVSERSRSTTKILEPSEKELEHKDDIHVDISSPHKVTNALLVEQVTDSQEAKETNACSEDDHLKDQITKYQEEILKLNEILKSKENELESGRNLLRDMQHSLQNKEVSPQKIEHSQHVNSGILESCDFKFTNEDKIALQATVDSLQNIIVQKEDTISRYQKFLQDIREEDGRIISALQEHLRVQQADLTAQEQAYVRLKISMRQLSLEVNGENYSKASLNLHLMRCNELEDEVSLLKAKVQAQSSELQQKQQEASYWRSAVQQHLSCIEDLNNRLSDSGNVEKKPPLSSPSHEKLMPSPSKSIILTTSLNKNYFEKQNWRRPRAIEGYSRVTESQIHMQINSEVAELRNKIQQMEEQEQRQKNEIQRLRDQIPIYSRRVHQSQAGAILPERETELLKKIKSMDQQMEQLKADHEKTLLQRTQQESKKVKSAENVARWDERKKHQIQIERLKSSLQEQTDETALLLDKVDRMHSTIHRLEREKIALEHQLKNLLHVQQEKTMLEERLKNLENNELTQCMFEELQNDRDKLLKEVQTLRVKGSASNVENKLSSTMLCELNSQKDEMYTKTKAQREKDISRENDVSTKHQFSNAAERDKANLLKANLELECQNLELKLELEKLRAEAPCLRHKVTHLERLLNATQEQKIAQSSAQPLPETLGMEEKTNLQQLVRHLSAQLEAANQRVQSLENFSDNGKLAALQTELNQKSLLLGKVKILLERAAFKERQLTEQVCRLQSEIDLK